jgi:hypothetical protein
LRAAILAEQPADVKAKERLANNIYITARTLWNDSATQEAEAEFQKGVALQRQLVAAAPDSVEYKNRLALLLIDYAAIPAFNFQAAKAGVLIDEALRVLADLGPAESRRHRAEENASPRFAALEQSENRAR